jgi:MoaA/NifB/PqqE/SkfB family radical SAM enzyme
MKFEGLRVVDVYGLKICRSSDYNYIFNQHNGSFMRWGVNKDDDPSSSPSPEILDLEISSGGDCLGNCKFCYKCNGGDQPTYNMTFEQFKNIFHKVNANNLLTQIAFGIMNIGTNPDFFKMMEYARYHGVIPNYTCHGLDVTPEIAQRTANLCGAVAVSLVNKEKTYNAIQMFLNCKMKQVNIHYMLSEETYNKAFKVVDNIASDPRLKGFNAIVFLQYKSKGRNPDDFHSVLDIEKYQKLTQYCDERNIRYGFDSCSANLYLESIKGTEHFDKLSTFVEPCESGLFSSYINYKGEFVYCSFAEGVEKEMDVLGCKDFIHDIWNSDQIIEWRKRLLSNNRCCPIYDLSIKK